MCIINMNSVDTNHYINKYTNIIGRRHVNYSNNISFWTNVNIKHIHNRNFNILNSYKCNLNKLNINCLMSCIKCNILIDPVYYLLDLEDIRLIICCALDYNNVKILKNKINPLSYLDLSEIIKHINSIKTLKLFELTNHIDYMWKYGIKNNHMNIIKHIHKKYNYRILYDENDIFDKCLCNNNMIMIDYLHKKIGFVNKNATHYKFCMAVIDFNDSCRQFAKSLREFKKCRAIITKTLAKVNIISSPCI